MFPNYCRHLLCTVILDKALFGQMVKEVGSVCFRLAVNVVSQLVTNLFTWCKF